MKKIFLISFFLFLVPTIIQGNGIVPCGGQGQPCQLCHLFVMIKNITDFVLFKLVPPLAILMMVIGGVMFIFASSGGSLPADKGGGPALLNQAKKLITSVVMGLVIIYAAWLLISTFLTIIGLSDVGIGLVGPEKWFKINCPIY